MDNKNICNDRKRIKFKPEIKNKYFDMSIKDKRKSFLNIPKLDY
uniref:Uncharacterized protein n=1 Tax=viral metagenome TaxID=1070528 RepID=A0A6C0CYH9_9ZZZZ